jgi:cytochrome c oxidase subunit 3
MVNIKKLKNLNKVENEQHPFHLVEPSPWPLMTSMSLLSLVLSFILYFHYYRNGAAHFIISLAIFCFFLFRWFKDIIIEATFEGHHTLKVQKGIKLGMMLFIASEVMFFFSFFWAFFHCSLSPAISVGCVWPPIGIQPLDPWGLPLLNTIILLSSGVTITWTHRAIVSGDRHQVTISLISTIGYGLFFSAIQFYEYNVAPFSINDSVYGTLFFILTGFHGLHIIVGTIMLIVCLVRHINYHFTTNQHVGLECAIWYWHFVDVVWLFLLLVIYIWGGN